MAAGASEGLNNNAARIDGAEEKKLRLQHATNLQKQSSMELEEYAQDKPLRDQRDEVEMQQLKVQSKNINQQALSSTTFSAFDRYNADGNVRHLNTWLADAKKNPAGENIYGTISRYDAVTQSPETDKLLTSNGYNPQDVYSDPKLAADLTIVTNQDGTQTLLPKNVMFASTGYDKYLTDEELKEMETRARINKMLQTGTPKHKVDLKEQIVHSLVEDGKAGTLAEAYQMVLEMESSGKGTNVLSTADERGVAQTMETKNVDYLTAVGMFFEAKRGSTGKGETNESRYIADYMVQNPDASRSEATASYKNLGLTSTQKEIGSVRELRKGLDKMDWLESSPESMSDTQRSQVYRDYISPLEDLRNFKMSNEDKRTMRDLRNLTQLGGVAGTKLSEKETGLIDSSLNSLKKYMFDEVGGTEGTSAYETFRNIFRNSLYGASLTKSEISAFNKAAGTLGKQFQPAMTALKVQMETVKSQMESIRDLNDPDIAHYYTGQSIDKIDRAIQSIEERIDGLGLAKVDESFQTLDTINDVQEVQAVVDPEPALPGTQATFNFDAAMEGL